MPKICTSVVELSVRPRLHALNSYDAAFPFGREIKECLLWLGFFVANSFHSLKVMSSMKEAQFCIIKDVIFFTYVSKLLLCRREYVGAGERLEFFLKVRVCF